MLTELTLGRLGQGNAYGAFQRMNAPGMGSTGGTSPTGWSGSMSADYDFQKSVLGAAYSGAGALVDMYA